MLAVLLAWAGTGCQTLKDDTLTGNLWQKDPTHAPEDHHEYIYGPGTRATLTPFAVVGDVTVFAVVVGSVIAVESFAGVCQSASQNGGRVY
jgi:hypothetical protein